MNLKEKYKNTFDKVDNINSFNNDSVINRKNLKMYYITKFASFLIIIIIAFSTVTVVALGVNKVVNSKVLKDDNTNTLYLDNGEFKDFNYDAKYPNVNIADIMNNNTDCIGDENDRTIDMFYGIDNHTNSCYEQHSYEDYEKNLGIKLLRSHLYNKDNLIIKNLTRNDGKISRIDLESNNLFNVKPIKRGSNYEIKNDYKLVQLDITLLSKYYDGDYHGSYPVGNSEEYYIKNLDASAIIYHLENPNMLLVSFYYDGILYQYYISVSSNYNVLDVSKEILDSLYIE